MANESIKLKISNLLAHKGITSVTFVDEGDHTTVKAKVGKHERTTQFSYSHGEVPKNVEGLYADAVVDAILANPIDTI